MGFVGWIATGIFIGILIGVVMKIFAKKNNMAERSFANNHIGWLPT